MKKILAIFMLSVFALTAFSQEKPSDFRIITGIRVNPFIMYDLQTKQKTEIMRLHAEVGTLIKKKLYLSAGYTPFVNAVYNFNEYWFIGFDKRLPVSWVIAEEYSFAEKKIFVQTGLNFKLSNIGNMFIFGFTPTNTFYPGIKAGVFIPLNFVIKN